MFRFLGNLISPRGEEGRLGVLYYHRTLPAPDPILNDEIDGVTFERHITFLASEFNVIPLGEACARLANGSLPARALSITFDDGYASNEQIALPILHRLKLSATFFIATGFLEGGVMFNDAVIETVRAAASGMHDLSPFGLGMVELDGQASRRAAADRLIAMLKYRAPAERAMLVEEIAETMRSFLPRNLMMTPAQIRALHRAGMEIGAHTVNHPILTSVGDEEARAEIRTSKRTLEDIIGAPVTLFAYPNGKPGQDYAPQHVRFVREAGFSAAVSTVHGICHGSTDPFQLPRIGPWDSDPRRLAARLLYMCARKPAAVPLNRDRDDCERERPFSGDGKS